MVTDSRSAPLLLRWLHRLEDTLLVSLVLGLLLLAAYQVIARNFFGTGIVWGDGLVRVLVFWVTIVGAMMAARRDEHIRIDLVSRFAGPTASRYIQRLANAFACVMCALLAWFSYQFVLFEYQDGTLAFASVPAWLCESVLPVGAVVLTLRYALRTVWLP